ncbi:MAG: chloride channel protein, partial [Candidatus Marinimicrobia bacterium]|nr:chloride channel protein [Candidatus Neomarinimicrobiota bacterium]
VVSRHFIGDHLAFTVPEYHLVSPLELIPYTVLGVLSGLVALAFIKMLYKFEDIYDGSKYNQIIKTGSGGVIIGLMGIFIPAIFGVGYDSMDAALQGQLVWSTMLMLVFAKLLATSVSLGSGGSGGIFAPSLFLGTMTGGFFGALIHQFFPAFTAESGAYSLVGMAAVVAGATHAPLTAILIIFEMTNDYKIILPLMISSIIAVLVTRKYHKESIYTLKLVRKGINLFAGRDINILRQYNVGDLMSEDVSSAKSATPLKKILAQMLNEKNDEIFITDNKERFLGVITLNSVKEYLIDQDILADIVIASDIMDFEIPTLKVDDKLDLAMHLFGRREHKILPVISTSTDKKLLGVVNIQDAINTYNKELFKRDLS